jgi:hypothetical protein
MSDGQLYVVQLGAILQCSGVDALCGLQVDGLEISLTPLPCCQQRVSASIQTGSSWLCLECSSVSPHNRVVIPTVGVYSLPLRRAGPVEGHLSRQALLMRVRRP